MSRPSDTPLPIPYTPSVDDLLDLAVSIGSGDHPCPELDEAPPGEDLDDGVPRDWSLPEPRETILGKARYGRSTTPWGGNLSYGEPPAPPIPEGVQVNDENPPEPGNVGLLDGAIGRRSALRENHPRQWWIYRLCNAVTTGRTREAMYALLSRCAPCGLEWRYGYVLDADGKNATYPTPRQGQYESLRAQLRYLANEYNGGKYLVRCPTCGGFTRWEVESFDALR